jgi:hypothetical protein
MTDLFLKLGLGKPSLKIKTFKMENVETPGLGESISPSVVSTTAAAVIADLPRVRAE